LAQLRDLVGFAFADLPLDVRIRRAYFKNRDEMLSADPELVARIAADSAETFDVHLFNDVLYDRKTVTAEVAFGRPSSGWPWRQAFYHLVGVAHGASAHELFRILGLTSSSEKSYLEAIRPLLVRLANPFQRAPSLSVPKAESPILTVLASASGSLSTTDVATIKMALVLGADPDAQDVHGATALHYAFALGNVPLQRMLLQYHACIHVRNHAGVAPEACVGKVDQKPQQPYRVVLTHPAKKQARDPPESPAAMAAAVAAPRGSSSPPPLVPDTPGAFELLLPTAPLDDDNAVHIVDSWGVLPSTTPKRPHSPAHDE
jgi:hypothetical protein